MRLLLKEKKHKKVIENQYLCNFTKVIFEMIYFFISHDCNFSRAVNVLDREIL